MPNSASALDKRATTPDFLDRADLREHKGLPKIGCGQVWGCLSGVGCLSGEAGTPVLAMFKEEHGDSGDAEEQVDPPGLD